MKFECSTSAGISVQLKPELVFNFTGIRKRDCEGGAPVVLLDAQAIGMPVISTTHCDIPDEVIHGETGMLAPEKDIEALSQYISSSYRMRREEYAQCSENARSHVENNYNVKVNSEFLNRVYFQLASNC